MFEVCVTAIHFQESLKSLGNGCLSMGDLRFGKNSLSWKRCQIQVTRSVTNGPIPCGHLEKSLKTDQNDRFK